MRANLNAIFAFVMREEGGYSNDKYDPGKGTMKGVTQATYDDYRRKAGLAKKDVRGITDSEVLTIFRQGYWNAVGADLIASGLDLCGVDGAYNSGPAQAKKWLSRAALASNTTVGQIKSFCTQRMEMLRGLKTWWRFGKGWTARVARCEAAALRMAGMTSAQLTQEASLRASSAAISQRKASSTAAGGTAATGATATATAQMAPAETLALVVFAVIVIGAIVAVLVWRSRTDKTRSEALYAEAAAPLSPDAPNGVL